VLRGGAWGNDDNGVRSADRVDYDPDYWIVDRVGFRCVRSQ
jgi:formylglycine-generating enzyme required for sulfatase activity